MGRLSRLCLKELRETLRDRRTMFTLIVMPLMVYPLLAIVFQRFLLSSLTPATEPLYVFGFESQADAARVLQLLEKGNRYFADEPAPTLNWMEAPAESAQELVAAGAVDVAVLLSNDTEQNQPDGLDPVTRVLHCELLHRPDSPTSEAALAFLARRLTRVNEEVLREQLQTADVQVVVPARITPRAIAESSTPAFSLAALLPLILVLMTVTGAVYPAIDLTAGERERGTLEMLIAAPVPRIGLLFAKYAAVLCVAILTAVVNLVGMTITAKTTGLDAVLMGDAGFSLAVVLKVFALLVLFAAFFSGILLALTSYTRSFKEAQAFIIPLMLLCLVPGILCLLPGLQLTGLLAVTPLVNIVLLARDMLEGAVDGRLATVAVLSTGFYVLGAVALAARIFGTDAILYGSEAGWFAWANPTRHRRPALDATAAIGCLAALFPCYFVLSGLATRTTGMAVDRNLVLCSLVTILLFAGTPFLVCSLAGVPWKQGLRLSRPAGVALLGAAVLGLSLWPTAFEIVQWQRAAGMTALGDQQLASVKQLADSLPEVPIALLLVTLAVVPGVCEELFFRGFLMSALRTSMSPAKAIIASAVLFGVFHVVTASMLAEWRFLPSTFLGLALGWVCYRTGSVIPGMVLHVLHNGFLVSLAHYQHELANWGLGSETASHLPATWVIGSFAVAAVGIVLVARSSAVAAQTTLSPT